VIPATALLTHPHEVTSHESPSRPRRANPAQQVTVGEETLRTARSAPNDQRPSRTPPEAASHDGKRVRVRAGQQLEGVVDRSYVLVLANGRGELDDPAKTVTSDELIEE
jgi:hypothetical protein